MRVETYPLVNVVNLDERVGASRSGRCWHRLLTLSVAVCGAPIAMTVDARDAAAEQACRRCFK